MSGLPIKRPAKESASSNQNWLDTIFISNPSAFTNTAYLSANPQFSSGASDPAVNADITNHTLQEAPSQARQEMEPNPKKVKVTNEFSTVVKRKLQSSRRTGQACDRCKVRKIRCDALPDGCSHCMLLNLHCFVTDRVTGRTERRGYLKELETEVGVLHTRLHDLELLLASQGTEVFPLLRPNHGDGSETVDPSAPDAEPLSHTQPMRPDPQDGWYQSGTLWLRNTAKPTTETDNDVPSRRPSRGPPSEATTARSPRQGSTPSLTNSLSYLPSTLKADNVGYVGASMDAAPLSSLSGTKLLIMGTAIDTGDFERPDYQEGALLPGAFTPRYNKSVQALLQSMMNRNPPLPNMSLPPRDEAFRYSQWYFIMLEKFLPLLHQPTFWKMLTRIYDEPGYEPTASEAVLVHIIYATMLFHYGIRNINSPDDQAKYNELSNKHYHHALSRFYELLCERSIQACQAITLLAIHARNFPKPHAAIILSNQALGRAWSMNLNRRANPTKMSCIDIEMRKRLWWVILLLNVTMQGYMGRPMPVTNRDYDVGFPEPIHDDMITENGIDTSKNLKFPYWVGLAVFRMMPLFIDLYSHLYSTKRDFKIYATAVAELETRLQAWKSSLPIHLIVEPGPMSSFPPDCDRVTILYIQEIEVRFRFFLRHPNVSMTHDSHLAEENIRICESLSEKMLSILLNLLELKSLDTTWASMSMYGAFMFTTIAAHWQRRFTATCESIYNLRVSIDKWMVVINEVGCLIGAGNHAIDQMRNIADRSITQIEEDSRPASNKSPDMTTPSSDVQSQSRSNPAPSAKQDMSFLNSFHTHHPENSTSQSVQIPSYQYKFTRDPSTEAVASAAQARHHAAYNSALYYSNECDDLDEDEHEDHAQPFTFPSSQPILPPTSLPNFGEGDDDDNGWPESNGSTSIRNAWREWAEAVVENPQRQAFNNFLPLNPPNPNRTVPPVLQDTNMRTQWPMLVFHDPNLNIPASDDGDYPRQRGPDGR